MSLKSKNYFRYFQQHNLETVKACKTFNERSDFLEKAFPKKRDQKN